MLKDLTRTDWLSILDLPPSRVPPVVILRGTRNFRVKYQAMLPHFANVQELGTPNGIIVHTGNRGHAGFLIDRFCVSVPLPRRDPRDILGGAETGRVRSFVPAQEY